MCFRVMVRARARVSARARARARARVTDAVLRRDRAASRGDPLVHKGLDGAEHRRARLEYPWWR